MPSRKRAESLSPGLAVVADAVRRIAEDPGNLPERIVASRWARAGPTQGVGRRMPTFFPSSGKWVLATRRSCSAVTARMLGMNVSFCA